MSFANLCDPGYGSVHLYTGPMFSGKTSEVLTALDRYDYVANAKVLLFKYYNDTRDKETIVKSRRGFGRKVYGQIGDDKDAWALVEKSIRESSSLESTDANYALIIGIDEGQFIRGLHLFVQKVLDHKAQFPNITMILYIAALDSTFKAEMWPEIVLTLPYCSQVKKFTAICAKCQTREAFLTMRNVQDDRLELIGSEEAYSAVCYACYNN